MIDYAQFLDEKSIVAPPSGFNLPASSIHPALYDFQGALVRWALRQGRAAILADTGLGKTIVQLEWARHIPGTTLIVCPLSVAEQTIAEGKRYLGMDVHYVRSPEAMAAPGVYITNYDIIKAFAGMPLNAMVLDESSCLRSEGGKIRTLLIEKFQHVPYRLCCSATPAPNDIVEICNHAAFLGIMTREKTLSTFFVHDEDGWRLRGHASSAFYRWITSWALAIGRPEDIGFDGTRFVLPPLRYHQHVAATTWRKDGHLFPGRLSGITETASVRRRTANDRVAIAVDIARKTAGQMVIWCGLNDESSAIAIALTDEGSIELYGTQDRERKLEVLQTFLRGEKRILVSKAKIAGRGMNFQCAHTQIFLGLSYSWEDYYQCTRRLWRYGQAHPVDTHIIVSDHELGIVETVQHKEAEAKRMTQKMITASAQEWIQSAHEDVPLTVTHGDDWTLWHGDCVETMRAMLPQSIDLSVFSPPFMALYQYTGTVRDVGNSKSQRDFFRHFKFVSRELLRITKAGRICAMHLSQVPAMQVRDGYIGMRDFRGPMIAHMGAQGWIYHGEVVVNKNPQSQAIRIRAKGLAFQQLEKDASWMRPALADMVLLFRAPGENAVPVDPECSRNEWINWAHPVWNDIRETHTLNAAEGRDQQDDRHIHPLQLDVIERCIRLWSNRGETVFDPFSGIASTGYVALNHGRKYIGCELKDSYHRTGIINLNRALVEQSQIAMF